MNDDNDHEAPPAALPGSRTHEHRRSRRRALRQVSATTSESVPAVRRRWKQHDQSWVTRLAFFGRGSYRRPNRPVSFLAIGGSRPYLNIFHGTNDENWVTSLSEAEAGQLAAFLTEHFGRSDA